MQLGRPTTRNTLEPSKQIRNDDQPKKPAVVIDLYQDPAKKKKNQEKRKKRKEEEKIQVKDKRKWVKL